MSGHVQICALILLRITFTSSERHTLAALVMFEIDCSVVQGSKGRKSLEDARLLLF